MPNTWKKRKRKVREDGSLKQLEPKNDRGYLWVIALLAVVVGSFLIRVIPQLDIIFNDGIVMFKEVDPWLHMRMVDSLLETFPVPISHDPYALYPGGLPIGFYPLLSWLIVGITYIITLGQPTLHTAEVVAAFLPPIAGALVCIPTYIIGREMGNKALGLVAAVFVAILPAQFFFRSLLGFTDHHVFEVLLSVTAIALLLLALRREQLRYAVAAGIALGLYYLNWHGAPFMVFILWLGFMIQFYRRWASAGDTKYLVKTWLLCFGIAALMFLPYLSRASGYEPAAFVMLLSIGTPLVLLGLRRIVATWERGVVGLFVIAGVTLAGVVLIKLSLVGMAINVFESVFWAGDTTISEAKPPSLAELISAYGFCFLLAFGGFVLLAYRRGNTILLIWCAIMFAAAFAQIRWGYYFVVNVALLSSYFMFWLAGFLKEHLRYAAVAAFVFLVVVVPNYEGVAQLMKAPNHINASWYRSLTWLRENSPEPLPDGVYFTDGMEQEADYSVLSWWDYGHWISRIAHRVPLCTPASQLGEQPGAFLAAQTPEEGESAIAGLNVQYIIIDDLTVWPKFHAVVRYANTYREKNEMAPYPAGWQELQPTSNAALLWQNRHPDYKLVYADGNVRVFERI